MALSHGQSELSHEELKKDVHMRAAEALLKEVNPHISFEWAEKGSIPNAAAIQHAGGRTVIQMEG